MSQMISILIPTHNRCSILASALKSLLTLRIPHGVDAELIVVANACTDDTEKVVAAATALMPMPVRCVAEPKLGLNVARNRAAAEAKGDILAYLDDDVWVEPDWLIGLIEVYDNEPADLVGGRVFMWWESVKRPGWMTKEFETMLSACDHGEEVLEFQSFQNAMIGANFSFRRKVLSIGDFKHGLDRKGASLLSGGETEFVRRAQLAGFRLFYAPRARVLHWVAPHRVQGKYMRRLAFDFGRSDVFMSPSRPRWRWWPTVLRQPACAVFGFCGEIAARLEGNRVKALGRHFSALGQLGRAAGALQLMCGYQTTAPEKRIRNVGDGTRTSQ